LVNASAEIVGVAPAVVELDVVELDVVGVLEALVAGGVAAVVLELLEFELPHAATPKQAVTARAAVTALLFSKCTLSSSCGLARQRIGTACGSTPRESESLVSPSSHATTVPMNKALTSGRKA
jgi:hypothetical protein